ncbi:MAG: ATP phosphoribosyltransferase regulatory subunit [Pyrinomonadaceae bacterium]
MASTHPADATREVLPADVRKRNYVIGIIKEVCESSGFEPLESAGSIRIKSDQMDTSVEANAIVAVHETLCRLGVNNFAIYFSHSDVLAGIMETVRVPEALRPKTFAAIRSFNKFNIEGFVAELQEVGVSENASTVLAEIFRTTDEILNQEGNINQTVVSNLLNIVNLDTLTVLGSILRSTGRLPVFIDPALPCESRFDAGIVMEARTSGLDILGEGGSIDRETVFAFSFDIDNIIGLMDTKRLSAFEPAASHSVLTLR